MGFFDPEEWNELIENYEPVRMDIDEFIKNESKYDYQMVEPSSPDDEYDGLEKRDETVTFWKIKDASINLNIHDQLNSFKINLRILKHDHPNLSKRNHLHGRHIIFADSEIIAKYKANSSKYFSTVGLRLVNVPFEKFGDRMQPVVKIADLKKFNPDDWILLMGNGTNRALATLCKVKYVDMLTKVEKLLCLHPLYWEGYPGIFSDDRGGAAFKEHLYNRVEFERQQGIMIIPLTFFATSNGTSDHSAEELIDTLDTAVDVANFAGIFG